MKIVPSQWPAKLPAKIAWVGEAPGDVEQARGVPLVGPSGRLHNRCLRDAGIDRAECFTTNVLDFVLKDNRIESITVPQGRIPKDFTHKDVWLSGCHEWIKKPVESGAYLPAEIAGPALARLQEELNVADPTVVVALGGLAVWALLNLPGHGVIRKVRGTVHEGVLTKHKVIPAYHPAYILRKFQMYPLLWADYLKARREAEFPEIKRAELTMIVPRDPQEIPGLFNILSWPVAVDIETKRGLIDCIGFSDEKLAFTVPIFNDKTFKPYWSREGELTVRHMLCEYLSSPALKIFQNGSYDVQMLWEIWKVQVHGYAHDTRLLHHALYPELPKDLGTMAALHTDLPSWKPIKGKQAKRED